MEILTSLMSTIFTSAVMSKKTGPQNAVTSAASHDLTIIVGAVDDPAVLSAANTTPAVTEGMAGADVTTITQTHGNLFFDANEDGIYDSSEAVTLGQMIDVADLSKLVFTGTGLTSADDGQAFKFTATDINGNSGSEATVTINVNNPATAGSSIKFTGANDISETIQLNAGGFLFNNSDGPDNVVSIKITSLDGIGNLGTKGDGVTTARGLFIDANDDGDFDDGEHLVQVNDVISYDDIQNLAFEHDDFGTSGSHTYSFTFRVIDELGLENTTDYTATLEVV